MSNKIGIFFIVIGVVKLVYVFAMKARGKRDEG